METKLFSWIFTASLCLGGCIFARAAEPWPAVSMENRPWTRWWWLGSAVDEKNLVALLKEYHDAGLGGVEICPIYGAVGYESRYIDFLSPKWMDMLAVTTKTAKKLGMGVDLTDGTGWPFGGPGVSAEDASSKVALKKFQTAGGGAWSAELPRGNVRCVMAFGGDGKALDITSRAKDGRIEWIAPVGDWKIYAVLERSEIQQVKRAAPGGEGNVLDPFSPRAMKDYLAKFDEAFANFQAPMPRAHFHDSYEYYAADWTPGFFDEFAKRRGYDLRGELPALFGDGSTDTASRVLHDYRQTIAELHLAYISAWTQWVHSMRGLSREQAHGSPTNLLDTYAAADIPETEVDWKTPIEQQAPMLKFASSAAHVSGKALASSETFTWAGEHFQVSLDRLKPTADFLFCAGINHIFLHGIPYSPSDIAWPGWQFYAAVNFGPEGGLWHDLPALTAYITRCQSILQRGRPDNDVLLYFPVDDMWQTAGKALLMQFPTPGKWMWDQPFYATAMKLWQRGFSFDEVSDQLLLPARCEHGRIILGGNSYRALVVPACRLMPVRTLKKLAELGQSGARIVFEQTLPTDVPGWANLSERRIQFHEAIEKLQPEAIIGDDLEKMLGNIGIGRETMVDMGLLFVRRIENNGSAYFLTNRGSATIDGWVPLARPCESAEILDPLSDSHLGLAATRPVKGGTQIYLQLAAGQSCIVRLSLHKLSGRDWKYWQPAAPVQELTGTWHLHFLQGVPHLPGDFVTEKLASWTTLGDAEAKRFAGTARYTLQFVKPQTDADDWLLDLGKVCESARIRLNGQDVGTVWCKPFEIHMGSFLRPGQNTIEIDVTNLAANAIADLDRRGVQWKSFHEINFVNREYQPFDASEWPLRDSGLIGPARLVPLKRMEVGR